MIRVLILILNILAYMCIMIGIIFTWTIDEFKEQHKHDERGLVPGDFIYCHNIDDELGVMNQLALKGIQTNFANYDDECGHRHFRLIVTEVD